MLGLVPRVKVNYNIVDVICSLFTLSKKNKLRSKLVLCLERYLDVPAVLLTSSGRASIYLILRSLNQKKVYIPAYTCDVVAEAAEMAGKEVYYVHSEVDSFQSNVFDNVDSDSVLIATHQYGNPCNIVSIVEMAHSKGAIVIEDCAGALGTVVNDKKVGTFGDYGIFSFDSSKLINVPSKGGFIVAKDPSEINRIANCTQLKSSDIKYKLKHLARGGCYCILKNRIVYSVFHKIKMGKNLQLSNHNEVKKQFKEFYERDFYEWQAVFAIKQMKSIEAITTRRKEVFCYYDSMIFNPKIRKPNFNNDAVCIRYSITTEDKEDFYHQCVQKGVDMGFSFNHLSCPTSFITEHKMATEVLNLPFYFNISDKEVLHVVDVVNSI